MVVWIALLKVTFSFHIQIRVTFVKNCSSNPNCCSDLECGFFHPGLPVCMLPSHLALWDKYSHFFCHHLTHNHTQTHSHTDTHAHTHLSINYFDLAGAPSVYSVELYIIAWQTHTNTHTTHREPPTLLSVCAQHVCVTHTPTESYRQAQMREEQGELKLAPDRGGENG